MPRLLSKILGGVSYFLLVINCLAAPLVLDPRVADVYSLPKQYWFSLLVLANLAVWALRAVADKKITYLKSNADWLVGLFILTGLLSAIFSSAVPVSFFGRGDSYVLNFISLLFFGLFFILLIQNVTTSRRWRQLINVLVGVGGVTALSFLLRAYWRWSGINRFLPESLWSTVDLTNSAFGVWLVVIILLSAGLAVKKSLSLPAGLLYLAAGLSSLLCLVALNFKFLWWLLLVGLALLILTGVSFIREVRVGALSGVFALALLVVIFIVFGAPQSWQIAVPGEVTLGYKPSLAITKDTLLSGVKPALLGSGLGTFSADFSQFRPAAFNNDPYAWSLRFSHPHNAILSLLSEGGLVLILIWIFLLLTVGGHLLASWMRRRAEQKTDLALAVERSDKDNSKSCFYQVELFSLGAVWLVLSGAMFAVFFGAALWWLWWLLLGLVVSGLSFVGSNVIQSKEITIEDKPEHQLSFSFLLIVALAAIVALGLWSRRFYQAEKYYVAALNTAEFNVAESNLKNAISYRANNDVYHATLAQIYLSEAVRLSRLSQPDVARISLLMKQAVEEAKQAVDLSPRAVARWENLATMYENAAALVPDARAWALKSLNSAKDLEPTNPVLFWRLGNNYGLAGQWKEAIESYQTAIRLKADHFGSYVGLANAYEQIQELNSAIGVYASIAPSAADNLEIMYNYGRLLYNRNGAGDRAQAQQMWEAIVAKQPNYSNALYSLGLLYENKKDKATALEYYIKVRDLNPGNADVSAKIKSLGGR